MKVLWVTESYVNASEGIRYGDAPMYETYFADDEVGKLYRSCRSMYGRCTGYVYVNDGERVGWLFLSRQPYEGDRPRFSEWGRMLPPETYLREVWVTVHEAPDTVERTHHYRRVK